MCARDSYCTELRSSLRWSPRECHRLLHTPARGALYSLGIERRSRRNQYRPANECYIAGWTNCPIRFTPERIRNMRENRAPRIALHCRDFFVRAGRYVQDNCIGSRSARLEPGASSRCLTEYLSGTKKDTHTRCDRAVMRSRNSLATSRRRPEWVPFLSQQCIRDSCGLESSTRNR